MQLSDEIPGYSDLISWCNGWPSFHDSEIIKLELNRKGPSHLIIHVMGGPKPTMGPRANPQFSSPPTDVEVTFILHDIDDVELAGFSSQNVIFGLSLEKGSECFKIFMDPCFGMAGTISAEKVAIEFKPVPRD